MSASPDELVYQRLQRLASLGDQKAARELLREALRRSDWDTYTGALEVVSPGASLSDATFVGDLVLTDDNLDAFARLEVVVGDLSICLSWQDDLSALGALREVHGQLLVEVGEVLGEVRLPGLESVGSLWISEHRALEGVIFPSLRVVEGEIDVHYNEILRVLDLGTLARCGVFDLRHNPALGSVVLPKLAEGVLRVQSMGGLVSLVVPSLQSAGRLEVSGCEALREVSFRGLCTVGGALRVERCVALDVLEFPSLVRVGSLYIGHNLALQAVRLPSLLEVETGMELSTLAAHVIAEAPELRRASFLRLGEGGFGSFRFQSLAALDALHIRDTSSISAGGRTVRTKPPEGELWLPSLARVRQSLRVEHDPRLRSLSLPALKELGDFSHPVALCVHDTALQDLLLSSLLHVKGALEVTGNRDLQQVDLSKLVFVLGAFTASENGVEIKSPSLVGMPRAPSYMVGNFPAYRSDAGQRPGMGALLFFVFILIGIVIGVLSSEKNYRGLPPNIYVNIPTHLNIPTFPLDSMNLMKDMSGRLAATSTKISMQITRKTSPQKSLCDLMGEQGYTSTKGDLDAASVLETSGVETPGCVRGSLRICGLNRADLQGLESIYAVEGDVEICQNKNLTTLSHLKGLAVVEGDIRITQNAALGSLVGLRVDILDGAALISENPRLSRCPVLSWLPSDALLRVRASDNGPDSLCTTQHLQDPQTGYGNNK